MNHKQRMKIDKRKHKVRKSWGTLNPSTKVEETEVQYNRNKEKKRFRKELFECEG